VLYRETVRPFMRTSIVWLVGSMPSTMYGPIGLKVSLFFARQSVRSPFCQARSLMSLPSV
jgi:hypothetical protein